MSTVTDPNLLFASRALDSLFSSALPKESLDYEYGNIERVLSRPQTVEQPGDDFAPGNPEEVKLLFSYIKFVSADDGITNIVDLSANVHCWFLERLVASPAVVCREWRTKHKQLFDFTDQLESRKISADGCLVRPFVYLRDPLCRHKIVHVLLSFDIYNYHVWENPHPNGSYVSQLWRWATHIDYKGVPLLNSLEYHLQVSLLTELLVILLDELQLRRFGNWPMTAIGSFFHFVRDNQFDNYDQFSFYGEISSSIRERANEIGGELRDQLIELLG